MCSGRDTMTKQGFFPHHYLCLSWVGRVLSVLPATGEQNLIHQPHCRWCHPLGPQPAHDSCQHPQRERGEKQRGWEKGASGRLGTPSPAATVPLCLVSTQLIRAKAMMPFPNTVRASGLWNGSELLDSCCPAFLRARRCSGEGAGSIDVVSTFHLLKHLSSLAAQAVTATAPGHGRAKNSIPVSTGL